MAICLSRLDPSDATLRLQDHCRPKGRPRPCTHIHAQRVSTEVSPASPSFTQHPRPLTLPADPCILPGASVEGSILVERSDANGKAYGYAVTAAQLLSGRAEVPDFAHPLIEVLDRAIGSVPDEWQHDRQDIRPPPMDRGYSFGSQYASGGSGEPQKLGGGRLGFPSLGGRARSKSSLPPRTAAELDPFGDEAVDGGKGKAGPAVSGNGQFEHQFTNQFEGEEEGRKEGGAGEKGEGWKGKLTKPRSATVSGYGVAGWAANNSFDGRKSSFRGGSTLDSDEEHSPQRGFTGTDDDTSDFASGRSSRSRPNLTPKKSSSRFLSFRGKSTPKAVDQSSMYHDPTRSPFADEFSDLEEPPKDRFERSPYGGDGGGSSGSGTRSRSGSGSNRPPPTTTTYKPWDSDEDMTMAGLSLNQGTSPAAHDFLRPTPAYESPTAGRSRSGSLAAPNVTRQSRSSSNASAGALDLRPVEADFASVAEGRKTHGFGVPSPQPRSRSNTAGGGLGSAIALFNFNAPGADDLAFVKGDVITILAQDDEEWWRGRLKLKEGMVPRNYVEFHKNE